MLSKAAVTHRLGERYVIENIEVASPKANEVMVKIAGCGLNLFLFPWVKS